MVRQAQGKAALRPVAIQFVLWLLWAHCQLKFRVAVLQIISEFGSVSGSGQRGRCSAGPSFLLVKTQTREMPSFQFQILPVALLTSPNKIWFIIGQMHGLNLHVSTCTTVSYPFKFLWNLLGWLGIHSILLARIADKCHGSSFSLYSKVAWIRDS